MTGTPLTVGTVLINAVFSTRDQQPYITADIEALLYDKISKILFDECYSPALIVGGDVEHTHILFVMARDWSVDRIIERVKDRSASFIKKWCPEFAWQESYAAVTIGKWEDEIVKDYIRRQKEVHKSLTYKDEFRIFLRDNGIEFDEDGLWD